jgi:hypothetical protein
MAWKRSRVRVPVAPPNLFYRKAPARGLFAIVRTMLIILVLAVILVLLTLRTNNKRFLIWSCVAALLLGVASILLFELLVGPHPECATNGSVGPCDYGGRVITDLPFTFVPATGIWIIILLVELLRGYVRKHLSASKK